MFLLICYLCLFMVCHFLDCVAQLFFTGEQIILFFCARAELGTRMELFGGIFISRGEDMVGGNCMPGWRYLGGMFMQGWKYLGGIFLQG